MWRTILLVLLSSCSTIESDRAEAENAYRGTLRDQYPEFEVIGYLFGPGGENMPRRSPEDFVDDILVGDFNFDGITDFAAALVAKGSVQQAIDGGDVGGFAAVCLGSHTSRWKFDCSSLTEKSPYGFRVEMELMDWTPWLDILLGRHPSEDDSECPIQLKNQVGKEMLSIVSSYGRCDTFYYFRPDASFGQCTYCAE